MLSLRKASSADVQGSQHRSAHQACRLHRRISPRIPLLTREAGANSVLHAPARARAGRPCQAARAGVVSAASATSGGQAHSLPVIIVGAGIAGLAIAVALTKVGSCCHVCGTGPIGLMSASCILACVLWCTACRCTNAPPPTHTHSRTRHPACPMCAVWRPCSRAGACARPARGGRGHRPVGQRMAGAGGAGREGCRHAARRDAAPGQVWQPVCHARNL